MEEMWVARDKDGKLAIFNKKPFKDREQWIVKGMFFLDTINTIPRSAMVGRRAC